MSDPPDAFDNPYPGYPSVSVGSTTFHALEGRDGEGTLVVTRGPFRFPVRMTSAQLRDLSDLVENLAVASRRMT